MEDCVINCGGPIEEPEDTTLGLEAVGGTEAVVAAALTSSVLTELPEETTSGLAEQPDQLMTTLPTQQHGNSSKSLPAATAACSDLAALSSGRAAPDSRAVCGLANDTRIERDFDSANGSQSEAAFDSANSSPSNSEAIAGASVESYVKSRAAAVNLNSMSGAADSIRRSHCPKEHEAPQLELEADADSCDTRYKWI